MCLFPRRILLGGLGPGRPERHHGELRPHQRPVVVRGRKWRWGAAVWFLRGGGASTRWSQLFNTFWAVHCLKSKNPFYHRCLVLSSPHCVGPFVCFSFTRSMWRSRQDTRRRRSGRGRSQTSPQGLRSQALPLLPLLQRLGWRGHCGGASEICGKLNSINFKTKSFYGPCF